jgi:hypothetical protein
MKVSLEAWTTGVRFSALALIFFSSPPHPDRLWGSYPISTWALSPGVKKPGRETDHLPPSAAEFKNVWNYTYTPPYVLMAWFLIKHRVRLDGVVLS